jgi:hypothetical protein
VELAVADSPLKLNVGPSCDAAARAAITLGRTTEMCMGDERAAQDQLTNNWSQYSRAHKTQCVGMTSTGGHSSYVELISCLDIMKDAAAIYKADPFFGDFGHCCPVKSRTDSIGCPFRFPRMWSWFRKVPATSAFSQRG